MPFNFGDATAGVGLAQQESVSFRTNHDMEPALAFLK